jgi:thiamine biosynthesis lipoprotein
VNKIFFLFSALIFLALGCGKPLFRDSEFTMGSFVEVISPDPRAKAIVFNEFNRLDKVFNLFDDNSELSRLNRTGGLIASEDLFAILVKSKEFYEVSAGAFDVTVEPLSLLWKRAIKKSELPKEDDIKDALDLVGFDSVYLDENTRQVRFLKFGVKIDLGGIAKGYAVDKAVSKLKEAGVSSAVVNAGGNMYCLGANSSKAWRVGIQDPRVAKNLIRKIELKDSGVSTSGDYEQFFVFQNKRYSHIINPKTGYPAESGIISATVVAGGALTADALSTSIVVLGREKGRKLIKRFPGVYAKVIDEHDRLSDL